MKRATGGAIGRDDLINIVAQKVALTKEKAKEVISVTMDGILSLLAQPGKLLLVNFGAFTAKKTNERQGRNPKTGAAITIPAGYKVNFKISKTWRDEIEAKMTPKTRAQHPATKPAAKPNAKNKRR